MLKFASSHVWLGEGDNEVDEFDEAELREGVAQTAARMTSPAPLPTSGRRVCIVVLNAGTY